MDNCFELFAREGYASLTMRRIADDLDVSTGTLYHYFSGKEDLFFQLVEFTISHDLFDAEDALRGAVTPKQRIENLFRFIQERESYFLNQYFIWIDYCRHEAVDSRKDRRLEEAMEQYKEGISRILDTRDPQLTEFILVTINGLIIQRLLHRRGPSLEALSRLPRRLIIRYMEQGFQG
ncbi:TetR/AcrR family transcriptional regulator [Paludifilum halophilum]|uniref:TetR/AcrR family transcriptional regulator n=1 Tax=Paludifilum halophilum TaxID=1642702 RepID=UPI00146AE038|nr:TetR/AcrR family transcriptional regulator [Paludifilum halophilum]